MAGQDQDESARTPRPSVLSLVSALLESERQRAYVAEELAGRYEEIELLYAISEILGRTVRLEEAAQIIVREVSAVVGARRASIMVFDEASGTAPHRGGARLRAGRADPVPVEDDCSIAARVFRERRTVTFDPSDPDSRAIRMRRSARLPRELLPQRPDHLCRARHRGSAASAS